MDTLTEEYIKALRSYYLPPPGMPISHQTTILDDKIDRGETAAKPHVKTSWKPLNGSSSRLSSVFSPIARNVNEVVPPMPNTVRCQLLRAFPRQR